MAYQTVQWSPEFMRGPGMLSDPIYGQLTGPNILSRFQIPQQQNINNTMPNQGGKQVQPIAVPSSTATTRMGNPDYTGQYGFPEKPTGFGGLRPLGGIQLEQGPHGGTLPGNDVTQDPGSVSIGNQFGESSLDKLFGLLSDMFLDSEEVKQADAEGKYGPYLRFSEKDELTKKMEQWIAGQAGLTHPDDIKNFIDDIGHGDPQRLIDKYYPGGFQKFIEEHNG